MHSVMNSFFDLALRHVHRYEGTINQFLGDGFMALFGAPVSHEDHARRAVLAALGILRGLKERNTDLGQRHGVELSVRIGLNTGLVVVGAIGDNLRMDYTAVGTTTNLAARLQQLAEPGTILVSKATHQLVEAFVQSTFAGKHTIKGMSAPQPVYRLESLKPGSFRFTVSLHRGLTPLIGRQNEVKTLERCCHEAHQGATCVVNVMGEAGIGKSRVVYELFQQLEGDEVFLLHGDCASYNKSTPFLPFIQVIQSIFHIREKDSLQEIRRKLLQGLERFGMKAESSLPLLLNLLGLDTEGGELRSHDSEIVGARTRELLVGLLREQCRLSPVVMFIDDLHWADKASEELLMRIIESEEEMPLLILCAYRLPYQPLWSGRQNVKELHLGPLCDESTARLVRHRLSTENISEDSTRLIVEKAEGNPLFAEEITQHFLETGSSAGAESDVSRGFQTYAVPVPGTLRDIIMARVDRLADDPRTLVQVASIVGRRFPIELVREVSGMNGTTALHLHDLEEQGLILCTDAVDGEEYQFKHALIQDAIYESLLLPRRRDLHQQVAEAIERIHAGRLGEWVDVLAHHYSHTHCAQKAVRYMALAGESSLRIYSLEEAHLRFREVVELLEAVPNCTDDVFLAEVLLNWVRVHYYRKDFKSIITLVERYLPRVEALGDSRHLSLLLFWLGLSHAAGFRYDKARQLLEKALALGEKLGSEECVGYACLGLMWVYWVRPGDQPRDLIDRLGERSLKIAGRLDDLFLACNSLMCLAYHKLAHTQYAEAREYGLRLLEHGREADDTRAVAMGLGVLGNVSVFYDERFEEAVKYAEEAMRLSPDPLDWACARAAKGAALTLMGQAQEGLKILRDLRRELIEGEFLFLLVAVDIPYGVAMVLAGRMAAGVRWIKRSIRRFSELGNDNQPATGHLALGEIYFHIAQGRREETYLSVILRNLGFVLRTLPFAARKSRYHLERAIQLARENGLQANLARGLLLLGLLCKARKRSDEARAHLEEAREILEPLGLHFICNKVDSALESLS